MPLVHIDLPIFIGPTVALGYFSLDVVVERMPREGEPFPWPEAWLASNEKLFLEQANQVWGQSPWDGAQSQVHFTLFGLVCSDREEADAVVRRIEDVERCIFTEHG